MMKKLLLYASFFLIGSNYAQINSFVGLNENSIHCKVNSNGMLFNDVLNASPGFGVEYNLPLYTIYANFMAFGGVGTNGDLVMTTPNYNYQLASGPLTVMPGTATATNEAYGVADITQARSDYWSQIFVIEKAEIDEFLDYRACLNDPNCDEAASFPGYQIPMSIQNWPAHGDTTFDEPYNLAPYVDANNDDAYNPNDGDFPCMKGDVYAWFVVNNFLVDPSIVTTSKGTEIQVEVYQYDGSLSDPSLENTVFVGYDVINRSTALLNDFYFMNFTDLDIGNSNDDYYGSLPNQNAYFGYNGDFVDEHSGGQNGFDSELPAQGIMCLNHNLNSVSALNPSQANYLEYYNVMRGYNGDGSMKYFPGTTVQTNFSFPYTSTTPFNWTESNIDGNGTVGMPGDRRAQGSVGPFTLTAGKKIELDFAFVYANAYQEGQGNEVSIATLMNSLTEVQQFYDTQHTTCSGGYLNVEETEDLTLEIYPNPTENIINVVNSENVEMTALLYSLQGSLVLQQEVNGSGQLDISSLENGAYLLKVFSEKGSYESFKILKK